MTITHTSSTEALLQENAFIDVQEYVSGLDRSVDVRDFRLAADLHIDLTKGALHFIQTYEGSISFVHSIKSKLARYGALSPRQLTACLDILRKEIMAGRIVIANRDAREVGAPIAIAGSIGTASGESVLIETGLIEPDPEHTAQCYKCHLWFTSVRAVVQHKSVEHFGKITAPVAVLKDEEVEATYLDISPIPDGRYAVVRDDFIDDSEDNTFWYFKVYTYRRPTELKKRFRFGKFHVGAEVLPVGTIEVRIQRGDTHELVGYQKPGEGYRGTHVEQLIAIMGRPTTYAKMYARMKVRCGICGKKLTQDESTGRGIGPDCFDRWGDKYWEQFSRYAAILKFREEHGEEAVPPWLYAGTTDAETAKKAYT